MLLSCWVLESAASAYTGKSITKTCENASFVCYVFLVSFQLIAFAYTSNPVKVRVLNRQLFAVLIN